MSAQQRQALSPSPRSTAPDATPIRLGVLGLGTVGGGLAQIMATNGARIAARAGGSVVIHKALVRTLDRERALGGLDIALTTDPREILEDDAIDVIVEVAGGVEPARTWLLEALRRGRTVVTANKDLLAQHGPELFEAARASGVRVYYEAAAAGGIPIIKALDEALAGNRIKRLMGIINGTTNYMLTAMTRQGAAFADVLADAQRLGYAEADPTSDVEGMDAAYKLALLASLAFDVWLDLGAIYREGITRLTTEDIRYADALGYTVKLLAIAQQEDDGVEARVHPTLVPHDHPLASVHGVYNAVYVQGDAVGDLMLYGRGAGALPTASAVMADIIEACQDVRRGAPARAAMPPAVAEVRPMAQTRSRFYLHIHAAEQPGALAAIAAKLAERSVSIASVIQQGRQQDPVSLVFITHDATEGDVQDALAAIEALPSVRGIATVLRVLGDA